MQNEFLERLVKLPLYRTLNMFERDFGGLYITVVKFMEALKTLEEEENVALG